jgi:hypothetical protein
VKNLKVVDPSTGPVKALPLNPKPMLEQPVVDEKPKAVEP